MKQKDFLAILIPLFILTILWVVFNIYHNYVTSTIKDPLSIQIVPIAGKFDTQTVDNLKQRARINPLYEISADVNQSPTPTPTPEAIPTEEASSSSELSPTVTEGASP